MERFLPGFKISAVHGKAMRREVEGIGKQVFYTLYHPAAALYNGGMRETLIKDFKRIPKIIAKIEQEKK
jgi:DNA polymerase